MLLVKTGSYSLASTRFPNPGEQPLQEGGCPCHLIFLMALVDSSVPGEGVRVLPGTQQPPFLSSQQQIKQRSVYFSLLKYLCRKTRKDLCLLNASSREEATGNGLLPVSESQ